LRRYRRPFRGAYRTISRAYCRTIWREFATIASRPGIKWQLKVLVAAQPTRGLDVKGVKAIQDLLVAERSRGVAILLISEDLDELLTLSDRLLVMHEGKILGEFDPETAKRHDIGAAMAGEVAT